jgi:glycogen operon protein
MRRQVIRDFWTFQVLSRGIPMFVWGDEFGRTVNGNNNAYNVDSVATWNNYAMIASASPNTVATQDVTGGTAAYANNLGTFSGGKNGNFIFFQYLLKLRAAHPAFRQQNYTSEAITFANADGSTGFNEFENPSARIYISGSQVGDSDFLLMSNMSGSSVTFTLPTAPAGTQWVRLIDTNTWAEGSANCWTPSSGTMVSGAYGVGNQSMVLLQAAPDTTSLSRYLKPACFSWCQILCI